MDLIKQKYRQRYFNILKRWKFKTKITGRNIAKLSRGGIYKPGSQAKILQDSKDIQGNNTPRENTTPYPSPPKKTASIKIKGKITEGDTVKGYRVEKGCAMYP